MNDFTDVTIKSDLLKKKTSAIKEKKLGQKNKSDDSLIFVFPDFALKQKLYMNILTQICSMLRAEPAGINRCKLSFGILEKAAIISN